MNELNITWQRDKSFPFGEMGLSNTTTSACVLSALTGADPTETVGPRFLAE